MSVTEATRPAPPPRADTIFGPITLEEMRANEALMLGVLPFLKRACDYSCGRFTLDQVTRGLIAGVFKVWGVLRAPADLQAVAVTAMNDLSPTEKIMEIFLIGGHGYSAMLKRVETFEQMAVQAHCTAIRLHGHKAWGRTLLGEWDAVYQKPLRMKAPESDASTR